MDDSSSIPWTTIKCISHRSVGYFKFIPSFCWMHTSSISYAQHVRATAVISLCLVCGHLSFTYTRQDLIFRSSLDLVWGVFMHPPSRSPMIPFKLQFSSTFLPFCPLSPPDHLDHHSRRQGTRSQRYRCLCSSVIVALLSSASIMIGSFFVLPKLLLLIVKPVWLVDEWQ